MELHHGYIIYVKLLFLPGNPWICPHLHGTYNEMASIKMKTGPDPFSFSPSYLSTILVLHFGFSLFPYYLATGKLQSPRKGKLHWGLFIKWLKQLLC